MFLVGLTGGIATGKSTVLNELQELGVAVVDGDEVARFVVEPGTIQSQLQCADFEPCSLTCSQFAGKPAWHKIKATFGDDVILESGALNRTRLGDIIFNSPEKRRQLNGITHPQIYKEIFRRCMSLIFRGEQFAVLDLPLLFESGYMIPFLHKIIVVRCSPLQQLERLIARNNLTRQEAEARINSQMSLDEKCARAHYVVDNSGDVQATKDQVRRIVEELRSSWAHWKYRALIVGGITVVGSAALLIIRYLFWS